jgi:hypothetical protein
MILVDGLAVEILGGNIMRVVEDVVEADFELEGGVKACREGGNVAARARGIGIHGGHCNHGNCGGPGGHGCPGGGGNFVSAAIAAAPAAALVVRAKWRLDGQHLLVLFTAVAAVLFLPLDIRVLLLARCCYCRCKWCCPFDNNILETQWARTALCKHCGGALDSRRLVYLVKS